MPGGLIKTAAFIYGCAAPSAHFQLFFVRINSKFHCWKRRSDVERIMTALDILVCPSISEGFPNVLGEALACEVPCLSNDVGDASLILDGITEVIQHRDPEKLAMAVVDLLQQSESSVVRSRVFREQGGRSLNRSEHN